MAAIVVLLLSATVVGAALNGARTPRDWALWAALMLVFTGMVCGIYLVATGLNVHGFVRTAIPAWHRCLQSSRRAWRFWLYIVGYVLIGAVVPSDVVWWQTTAEAFGVVFVAWLVRVAFCYALAAGLVVMIGLPLHFARLPSPAEHARLQPILSRLADAVGLDRVPLLVVQSSVVPWAAATPALILVTEGLLPSVDRAGHARALDALLAHELTHVKHRHQDRAIDLFLAAGADFYATERVAGWALAGWPALGATADSVHFLATLMLGMMLAVPLIRQFSRDQQALEWAADRGACELGYAEDVAFTLAHLLPTEAPACRLARWWPSTHPSRADRIAAALAYAPIQKSPDTSS